MGAGALENGFWTGADTPDLCLMEKAMNQMNHDSKTVPKAQTQTLLDTFRCIEADGGDVVFAALAEGGDNGRRAARLAESRTHDHPAQVKADSVATGQPDTDGLDTGEGILADGGTTSCKGCGLDMWEYTGEERDEGWCRSCAPELYAWDAKFGSGVDPVSGVWVDR